MHGTVQLFGVATQKPVYLKAVLCQIDPVDAALTDRAACCVDQGGGEPVDRGFPMPVRISGPVSFDLTRRMRLPRPSADSVSRLADFPITVRSES